MKYFTWKPKTQMKTHLSEDLRAPWSYPNADNSLKLSENAWAIKVEVGFGELFVLTDNNVKSISDIKSVFFLKEEMEPSSSSMSNLMLFLCMTPEDPQMFPVESLMSCSNAENLKIFLHVEFLLQMR